MLPGLGYTTQQPLFHYATGLFLNHQIDVLHINYQFAKNEQFKKLTDTEQEQSMYDDVLAVLDKVLKASKYKQFFVLGKSIGTIPMAKEWVEKRVSGNTFGIWLTPLVKRDAVYEAMMNTDSPSLCVIGDQDRHYDKERISSLKNNSLVSTYIIPQANHSLEITGDLFASIEALKEVMKQVEDFLKGLFS